MRRALGIRWTIGDVSLPGFQALRLSIRGAYRLFGPAAGYAVCVNTVPVGEARRRTGDVPDGVVWFQSRRELLPDFIARRLDGAMAEGVGWKFAPLRFFPERWEIALDNDCILWDAPAGLRAWLGEPDGRTCLVAEDVRPCFGQFADLCGPEPRNSGIRGVPPAFDLAGALARLLEERDVTLRSELDEQGLQMAALSRERAPHVVRVAEVSICSPFPPHLPAPGTCGVHFVGLNAKRFGWSYDGRPAEECVRVNFERWRPLVEARVGLEPAAAEAP